jgi:hypothetical protein
LIYLPVTIWAVGLFGGRRTQLSTTGSLPVIVDRIHSLIYTTVRTIL